MEPSEILVNVISFLNVNSEISKGRDLLVMIYKFHSVGLAFNMKMNSDDKI
jgi:hypothetical protein